VKAPPANVVSLLVTTTVVTSSAPATYAYAGFDAAWVNTITGKLYDRAPRPELKREWPDKPAGGAST
jgi:hypothetical protein